MGCSESKDSRKEKKEEEEIIAEGIIEPQKINNSQEIKNPQEKNVIDKDKLSNNDDAKTSSNENKNIKEEKNDEKNDSQKISNENKNLEEKLKNDNINNEINNPKKTEENNQKNDNQPPLQSNQIEVDDKSNNNNKNELPKTYTNEGNDIVDINNNDNYKIFKPEEKEYYLICPDCTKNIINIISIEYQQEKKDFIVTYKCSCRENPKKFLCKIISEEKGSCDSHRDDLIFLCEDCNLPLCDECLKEHNNHNMKNIINKEIISEEIFEKINEKKDEFKGINIIQKIYEFYKSNENKKETFINPINLIKSSQEVINSFKNINNINDNKKEEENNIPLTLINYKNFKTLKGNEEGISCLIKLKNNNIATGCYDGTVKIWDITKDESNALIMTKKAIGTAFCLLEFEQGKLLGGTKENLINLWDINDINNSESIYNFNRHYLGVQALVKCDNNHFASASNDTKIIIWNYTTRKYESTLEGHSNCIMDMIILQNGYLCTASVDKTIRIWDWKNLKSLFYFNAHCNYVKCLLELNNKYLITGSEDNTIGIWKEKSGNYENVKFLKGHEKPVRRLCQINDNYFASGSFDNNIKIWDLNKFECVQTLEGHNSNITAVIKIDEEIIISCSMDKTIKIWKKN